MLALDVVRGPDIFGLGPRGRGLGGDTPSGKGILLLLAGGAFAALWLAVAIHYGGKVMREDEAATTARYRR